MDQGYLDILGKAIYGINAALSFSLATKLILLKNEYTNSLRRAMSFCLYVASLCSFISHIFIESANNPVMILSAFLLLISFSYLYFELS